jgi:hypothetical protein
MFLKNVANALRVLQRVGQTSGACSKGHLQQEIFNELQTDFDTIKLGRL